MANPPAPAEGPPPDRPTPTEELIAAPPSGGAIVEDTAHATIDADRATTASQFVASQTEAGKGVLAVSAKFHYGPFPDPEALRELAELYPEAPRLIFEDFHAQSAHRRELEHAVITTKNILAIRGQLIAGTLGWTGLIGSLIVAGIGHGWAGFGIAMGSLVSLVSLFVYGREGQRKERLDKAKLRERIKRGEPIEELEGAAPSDSQQRS